MNYEQQFRNFTVTNTGLDAFENHYSATLVLFLTDGEYWYWTPDPRGDEDFYNSGLPDFVDEIGINNFTSSEAYDLPELAVMVGADSAWGFDL